MAKGLSTGMMFGDNIDDVSSHLRLRKASSLPLEDVSLASLSYVDDIADSERHEDENSDEASIPRIVSTSEPNSTEQSDPTKIESNSFITIGAWFHDLMKSGRIAPHDARASQDNNVKIDEPTTKHEENEDLESSQPTSTNIDNISYDLQESSKSNSFAENEDAPQSSVIRENVRVLFGQTTTAPESHEVNIDKRKVEKSIIQEHQGAFFGSRQRTSKDELSENVPGSSRKKDVYDESLKKEGGMRQKIFKFVGNKQRRLLCCICLVIFTSMVVLIPSINKDITAVGLFISSVGQVDKFLLADVVPHPLYHGSLFPSGQIVLRFDSDDRFLVSFGVEGLEPSCAHCTWIIVEGDTCHDGSKLGAKPFYDETNPELGNPFIERRYFSTPDGQSKTRQKIFTGYDFEQNLNHAIVLNDSNGFPLACGVLKKEAHPLTYPKLWANMLDYPMFNTTASTIAGKVRIDFLPDETLHVSFNFSGVPPDCFMCGIAIHTGTSCADVPGDHFWNSNKVFPQEDPWSQPLDRSGAFWQSNSNGTSTDRSGFYFYDGFSYDDHDGRVVILFDVNGVPISCGALQKGSSNHLWQATEAAIHNAMQTGTLIHSDPTAIADIPTVGLDGETITVHD